MMNSRICASTWLAVITFAGIVASGEEKGERIRISTWDGKASLQYDLAADSTLGKAILRWYNALPLDSAFSSDLKTYAPSRVIYLPNGARVNIAGNKIIAKVPGFVLDTQVSGQFAPDDPIMSEIVELIKSVEASIPGRKK
ncbi:MAG: hypothetical protein J0M17_08295 [Planctomycetes bacterium]|nr:hypothetical protein [Planctomycetota bacterium]